MKILSNSPINKKYLLVNTETHNSLNCPVCGILKIDNQTTRNRLSYYYLSWCYVCWKCVTYLRNKYKGEEQIDRVIVWVSNNRHSSSSEIEIPEDFPTREL